MTAIVQSAVHWPCPSEQFQGRISECEVTDLRLVTPPLLRAGLANPPCLVQAYVGCGLLRAPPACATRIALIGRPKTFFNHAWSEFVEYQLSALTIHPLDSVGGPANRCVLALVSGPRGARNHGSLNIVWPSRLGLMNWRTRPGSFGRSTCEARQCRTPCATACSSILHAQGSETKGRSSNFAGNC